MRITGTGAGKTMARSTSARCAQHEHTASGLVGQLLALHTDSGLLEFLASAAGAALLGAALTGYWPGWGRIQLVLGTGIASCGLADLVLLLLSDTIGTTERIRVLLTSGWFLVVGLLRQASDVPDERRCPASWPFGHVIVDQAQEL